MHALIDKCVHYIFPGVGQFKLIINFHQHPPCVRGFDRMIKRQDDSCGAAALECVRPRRRFLTNGATVGLGRIILVGMAVPAVRPMNGFPTSAYLEQSF